jgi:hypothetical protein
MPAAAYTGALGDGVLGFGAAGDDFDDEEDRQGEAEFADAREGDHDEVGLDPLFAGEVQVDVCVEHLMSGRAGRFE